MGVVTFDYATWSAIYPELVARGVTEPLATFYFGMAELLLDNSDASVVCDLAARQTLLYMIVAHIAATMGPGSSGTVGRVSSATEGAVSASLDYGAVGRSEAYWVQTPYGALFWAATLQYRTARYIPGVPRYMGTSRWANGWGRSW